MNKSVELLIKHKDVVLKAEIAAWLHNLGKLDPNFLVMQTEEKPHDVLGHLYRIRRQYSFRRFCKPVILLSSFPYENLAGVLYCVDLTLRKQQAELETSIIKIQEEIRFLTGEEKKHRCQEFANLKNQKEQKELIDKKIQEEEEKKWLLYEQNFDKLVIPLFNWSLGALLTLFWDGDFIDKPDVKSYVPGNDDDPDYQRRPKPEIILQNGYTMELPMLLALCHGEVSGQEKKGLTSEGRYSSDEIDYSKFKTTLEKLYLSSPFGYENIKPDWVSWPEKKNQIINKLPGVWSNPMLCRDKFVQLLVSYFQDSLADTQRPINEISLQDYSSAIASLFKTGVAKAVLEGGNIPKPDKMKWCLAGTRLIGMDYIFQANEVADLIARYDVLKKAYEAAKEVLEKEIPIGSAVYKDENGPVFVVPYVDEWEEIRKNVTLAIRESLQKREFENVTSRGKTGLLDVCFDVKVGSPERGKNLNMGLFLKEEPPVCSVDLPLLENWWKEKGERCPVCGLRPVGYVEEGLPGYVNAEKAKTRNVCGICLARRGRRAKTWVEEGLSESIWIDEVADLNGRIALIVGQFELDNWLDGVLIRTLSIGKSNKDVLYAKPPTFARIRRVWKTTRGFWHDIKCKAFEKLKDHRRRLILQIDGSPEFGEYHTYELDLKHTRLSVIWCPPENGKPGYFVSTANLCYIARLLGAEKEIYEDSAAAAIYVEDFIKEEIVSGKIPLDIRHSDPAADRHRNLGRGCSIVQTDHQDQPYSTAIPILAEPRTFITLVPADKALDVVKMIKGKYEREMGKVRNRLPLHLGIVFGQRRTPLRALLDAGQRMLRFKSRSGELWRVVSPCRGLGDHKGDLPDFLAADPHFSEWMQVVLENKDSKRTVTWQVPLKMGDGETYDCWYPYVFIDGHDDTVADRCLKFKAERPGENGSKETCWLVHAGELRGRNTSYPGDMIYFLPSTLDFEFLDINARRFEIAYENMRRMGQQVRPRPYLLEELSLLDKIWDTLSRGLTSTQIHALKEMIERKREEWHPGENDCRSGGVFWRFCRDAVAGVAWKKGKLADLDSWAGFAADGVLSDVVELHMQILKEKPKLDEEVKSLKPKAGSP